MDDEMKSVFNNSSSKAMLQLGLLQPKPEADEEWEIVSGETELPPDIQYRVKVSRTA